MAFKGNKQIFASAARTATPTAVTNTDVSLNFEQITNVQLVIDVTAASATPSVTPAIEAQDAVSGQWVALVTGTAVTAVGTTQLSFGIHTPVSAGVSGQGFIPKDFRVTMTHADADSITYSVGMNYVTE